MLTDHIPLPDPARGPIYCRMHLNRETREIYQIAFSNCLVLGEVHESVWIEAMKELNLRMRVYKELTC